MLKFYMDESGLGKNKDEKVCCVAGFIAQNSAWRGFHKNWKRLLEQFGLGEFKAKEFWDRRPDGSLSGKYANWSFDRANDFMVGVVRLIVSYRLRLLGSVVKLPDFFSYT